MRTACALSALIATIAACSGGDQNAGTGSAGDAGSDGTATTGDATTGDGGGTGEAGDDAQEAAAGCGEFAGDAQYTCSKDGNSRGKCVGGSLVSEACSRGCLREPAPQDSICMGTTPNWTCNGSYGKTPVDDGDYYLTSFGCWIDPGGVIHTDPGDNCIPTCLDKAIQAGLCAQGSTGPDCEEKVNWFTADGARFGCLARLRVTNPANGKEVVAVALDYGPACSVEQSVQHAVLDASGRINLYLFGGDQGASDKALVHVVQVDDSTPLGPK